MLLHWRHTIPRAFAAVHEAASTGCRQASQASDEDLSLGTPGRVASLGFPLRVRSVLLRWRHTIPRASAAAGAHLRERLASGCLIVCLQPRRYSTASGSIAGMQPGSTPGASWCTGTQSYKLKKRRKR